MLHTQRHAVRCSHVAPLPAHSQPRPKPIGMRYPLAWVTSTVSAPEAAVVKFAGVDALMYL